MSCSQTCVSPISEPQPHREHIHEYWYFLVLIHRGFIICPANTQYMTFVYERCNNVLINIYERSRHYEQETLLLTLLCPCQMCLVSRCGPARAHAYTHTHTHSHIHGHTHTHTLSVCAVHTVGLFVSSQSHGLERHSALRWLSWDSECSRKHTYTASGS